MTTHNNTTLTVAEVDALPVIATTVNNWRGRNIKLRQHPSDSGRVISDGTTFNGLMRVIADDLRADWSTALDYASHGKVYVSN